ncbi:hydrolase [Elizabethkingia sp. HX WHF]|uniref:Hydrolase n=1 Tax=Elizabethkingia bruuniana TaxID=1756149 RepID=A0A7T7UWY1_9FLAO|nr:MULTISPECIES: hydrolase [Elizabethkingia]ATL43248.1 hydrolase [Elizabethkingia miricola]AQX84320.1 hydrolase [Elizabethkingia bruuniana]KGO08092.1 amidase [Elizabethkingia miricola]KUY27774.1 hydrolase [Elizabethkingia bruuniana]MCL1638690.1 hydrolase [Elizabethkingia bruuniana]
MSSITPIRNPQKDHLVTPENSVLIVIDYQPIQINSINSMDRNDLVRNICALSEMAKGFNIPIILSTVNVATGRNKETVKALKTILNDEYSFDRTSINAWEDYEFLEAVKKTDRKNLIMCALWTEACLSFPALDALSEGYNVFAPIDCVGGTSKEAHNAALSRIQQAGARLTSLTQLSCEWQRDWNREETIPVFSKALVANGSFLGETL